MRKSRLSLRGWLRGTSSQKRRANSPGSRRRFGIDSGNILMLALSTPGFHFLGFSTKRNTSFERRGTVLEKRPDFTVTFVWLIGAPALAAFKVCT